MQFNWRKKYINIQLNNVQNKAEEYKKIVEKSATNKFNIKNKDYTLDDNSFQIDINLNNKQLNKTKFKDVPEDIIKN